MSKLDLNQYTNSQIVSAFTAMRVTKFIAVITAIGEITKEMTAEGTDIAEMRKENEVKKLIERMFEEKGE